MRAIAFAVAVGLLIPVSSSAQITLPPPTPAHAVEIVGTPTIQRAGRTDVFREGMPFLIGDRLTTDLGRTEIVLGDGTLLFAGANVTLDFLDEHLFRMLNGEIQVTVVSAPSAGYRFDTPGGSVQIEQTGEYRIVAVWTAGTVSLNVVRGAAELTTETGTQLVRAGQQSGSRTGMFPSAPSAYNAALWNEFTSWIEERRAAESERASAQYLPPDLQVYSGTLERYGTWTALPQYGMVWYPNVAAGWRPYTNGRWTVGVRGRTWVAADPWGWPTYYSGGWGFGSSGWFWTPQRSFTPAWTQWNRPGRVIDSRRGPDGTRPPSKPDRGSGSGGQPPPRRTAVPRGGRGR